VVIWSTCTLNPAENEELVMGADGLTVQETRTLLPHETLSAGFTVSRLLSER
jgi:16S rRNA C967 or C1407 C5-methylase (RsmB/RsmF family)